MQQVQSVELARDCAAVQIPAGAEVMLKAGTPVDITQTLGGTFTIHVHGALYRISGKDADALGLAVSGSGPTPDGDPETLLTEERVWDTLRTCYDPEIPVNIVDLGLVYSMKMEPRPNNRSAVHVKMTLTAPGCGMGGVIAGDAQQKLLGLPGVDEADVEVVWEPQWHHSMISEQGRKILGLE